MLLPRPNEKEFETAPAGTFAARCYRFVDLGTQPKEYMGTTSYKRMVGISWELPDELMKDGRPFSIYQKYVWSMSEKATLRKHLESWRGVKFTDADFGDTGFDTRKLIGVPCMLSIVHATKGDKTYANIGSVSKVMKGYDVPAAINETLYFSLDTFEQSVFDKLSQGMKETIMRSPEYVQLKQQKVPDHDPSEDWGNHVEADSIPF
jgi:hypothetical protein